MIKRLLVFFSVCRCAAWGLLTTCARSCWFFLISDYTRQTKKRSKKIEPNPRMWQLGFASKTSIVWGQWSGPEQTPEGRIISMHHFLAVALGTSSPLCLPALFSRSHIRTMFVIPDTITAEHLTLCLALPSSTLSFYLRLKNWCFIGSSIFFCNGEVNKSASRSSRRAPGWCCCH